MYEELTNKILDKYGWFWEDYARKPRSNTKGITYGDLIFNLLQYKTKLTAINLGCGEQTLSRTIEAILRPVFGTINGGNETWSFVLLGSIEYRKCSYCKSIKQFSAFCSDKSNSFGISDICKECTGVKNKNHYDKYKDIYHKKYIAEHRAEYNYRNSKRRADISSRTPGWANLDKIRLTYINCPEGHHVDHIIPLRGELVSGLHVENNLQYLLAEDNLKKSNKYTS